MESCEMEGRGQAKDRKAEAPWVWFARFEPSEPWGIVLVALGVLHLAAIGWLAYEVRQNRVALTRTLIEKEHLKWQQGPTEPSPQSPPQEAPASTEPR